MFGLNLDPIGPSCLPHLSHRLFRLWGRAVGLMRLENKEPMEACFIVEFVILAFVFLSQDSYWPKKNNPFLQDFGRKNIGTVSLAPTSYAAHRGPHGLH